MERKIRVIQYGVGPIGAAIVRLLLEKPMVQIIGAVDVDPAKVGQDVGRVAGVNKTLGIEVVRDARALLAASADVVVHCTSSCLKQVVGQLMECLQGGAHVVSTCEELAYPFRKHPELSERLDRCARDHNVALLGTGVNPGFAMDKMVLTLAAVCQRVAKIRACRVVDASRRRLPLQKKIGAGLTAEEFRAQVAAGAIKHHGLPESVAMVADALGLLVEQIDEVIEPVVAAEAVRTEYLLVPAGRVAGVRQVARGCAGGEENVRLELEMYVGAREPIDAVEIQGVPDLKLTVPGGIHGDLATAAIVVNCIPALPEAKPGLRTARDIPMCYFPALALPASVRTEPMPG